MPFALCPLPDISANRLTFKAYSKNHLVFVYHRNKKKAPLLKNNAAFESLESTI